MSKNFTLLCQITQKLKQEGFDFFAGNADLLRTEFVSIDYPLDAYHTYKIEITLLSYEEDNYIEVAVSLPARLLRSVDSIFLHITPGGAEEILSY